MRGIGDAEGAAGESVPHLKFLFRLTFGRHDLPPLRSGPLFASISRAESFRHWRSYLGVTSKQFTLRLPIESLGVTLSVGSVGPFLIDGGVSAISAVGA
jgi:hypothetical protein